MRMILVITAILGMTFNLNANDIMKSQEMINSTPNLEFIENRGQIADQHGDVNHNVLFIADVPYGTVTIRRDGISYSFVKYDDEIMSKHKDRILSRDFSEKFDEMEFEAIPAEIYRVDMRFNSSNFNPKIEAFEISDDYNNYYLAHCPDGIHYVRKYRTIKLIDVYPDIDFVIYANNDGLVQYDFVVKPGANPNSINFAFEGAENVVITNTGDLRIETPLGRIEQKAPIAYQPNNLTNYLNSRDYTSIQNIANNPHSQFIKHSDNSISFALTNYNPSKPLIIDPPTRLWGTYYGGGGYEYTYSIITDRTGHVYLTGGTDSFNHIATEGSHQNTYQGELLAFLVKFNKNGICQWGTYYGGNEGTIGYSVSTNELGDIYLVGGTLAENAIATVGSHQSTFGGGEMDAFLVKFNSDGIRLWGTYYGGELIDLAISVTTDNTGNVYFAGVTKSTTKIATLMAHQNQVGGLSDAFLVKFNSKGERIWGTYYGGEQDDTGTTVTTDDSGDVYIAGKTHSATGIATAGSHLDSNDGDRIIEIFFVKFNSDGVRQWGTYYSGFLIYGDRALAVDKTGNIYLTGSTISTSGIATVGSHQETIGGLSDIFLAKFNSNGKLLWGTYYGGEKYDWGTSVATDGTNNVYITGGTNSYNAIVSGEVNHGYIGILSAFLVKFNRDGVRQWGIYYGGLYYDMGISVTTDHLGNIFLAGETDSYEGIATDSSHQNTFGGVRDAFLVKFESQIINELNIPSLIRPVNQSIGNDINPDFQWQNVENASSYTLQVSTNYAFTNLIIDVAGLVSETYSATNLNFNSTYYWRVKAENASTTSEWSAIWRFTAKPEKPNKVTLILPADKSKDLTTELDFHWSSLGNVEKYNLIISHNEAFSDNLYDVEISNNTWTGTFIEDTEYFWKVRGFNDFENGDWSDTWSFRTFKDVSVTDGLTSSILKISPNPNSIGTALIELNLPDNGHIALTLYDINGKHIKSIFNDYLHSGTHNFELTTSNFPAGTYIIELTSGKSRITEKLVIIK